VRILVCPQEFKGSLRADEAARAIADGLRAALPDAEITLLPLADGGPGTASIVAAAAGAAVAAHLALLPDGRAMVEAAAAAGLVLVAPSERDPAHASTFGVGELVAAAIAAGATEVVVGVGGTGTNDGGAGALQALGARLLDAAGHEVTPGPLALASLARIDASAAHARLAPGGEPVRLRLAVDVRNPLLGPEGATAVYGPQKGVTPNLAPSIEAALGHWAALLARDLGVEVTALPGAGAGGGLAAGLAALGAQIESGAELVGEAVGLDAAIGRADFVVTGEGSLDAQTGYGKTVGHVAERCASLGVRCVAVAGVVAALPTGIADAEASALAGMPVEASMAQGAALVRAAAERLGRRAVSI
jgi:glycerate kinase